MSQMAARALPAEPQLTAHALGPGQAESTAGVWVSEPARPLREGPSSLWVSGESGGDSGPSSGLEEALSQGAPSFKAQWALSQAPRHQRHQCSGQPVWARPPTLPWACRSQGCSREPDPDTTHPTLLWVLDEERHSAGPGKVKASLVVVTMTGEHCLLNCPVSCDTQDSRATEQDHPQNAARAPTAERWAKHCPFPGPPLREKEGRGVPSQGRTLEP